MRGAFAIAVLAAALAASGCGADMSPHEPFLLALDEVRHPDLFYGSTLVLTGTVLQGDVDEVTIEADEWPYDGYERVATAPVDESDRFHYRGAPGLNALYRAVGPDGPRGASDPVPIYVYPQHELQGRVIGPRTLSLTARVPVPEGAKPVPRPFYFYVAQKGETRLRLVGVKRPDVDHGLVASVTAPTTGDAQDTIYLICVRDRDVEGMGRSGGPWGPPGCGNASLPARLAGR
jgi:hypothetical protein